MPVGRKARVGLGVVAVAGRSRRRLAPTTHQVMPPAMAAAPTADQAATALVLSCWVSFLVPAALLKLLLPRPCLTVPRNCS